MAHLEAHEEEEPEQRRGVDEQGDERAPRHNAPGRHEQLQ